WLVLPAALVGEAVRAKRLADRGTPTLEQLALARLIATGRLDRHLRIMRRRYRARRDALAGALAELGTGWRLEGVSAGLAAVARPPAPVGERALFEAARARSVGVYPVGWAYAAPRPAGGAVLLGYAGLPEPAIREGVRRLAGAYRDAAG
ncbi:MAG TPA: PLP-dependent aminotransferase family protein, partial [Solirubrobacteraceae bacterium]|nr:PLP-dependent aminotransferase family protein [Solirubrobacteraceae bacterium]